MLADSMRIQETISQLRPGFGFGGRGFFFERALLAGLCLIWGAVSEGWAQSSSNWRVFRATDGLADSYTTAVTLSPRGNIWVRHGEADQVTVWNGYNFSTMPAPDKNNYRIYESRSGQLWSLDSQGLWVHDGNQWTHHAIPEIKGEFRADPLRQVREIAMVPAERDRIFFLLSDQMMDYDAVQRRATVVRHVSETGLGRFAEMMEAQDGGIWVTGTRGLAKVPGPVRHIKAHTPWTEHIPEEQLGVENLQRPFENQQGGVTTLAFESRAPKTRVILDFDGERWSKRAVMDELFRQSWQDWEGNVWAYTINSLLRVEENRAIKEHLWVGQFKDVAADSNGTFWVATSEGLVRYVPEIWRKPAGSPKTGTLVHAILSEKEGPLWFASTESLIRFQEGRWSSFRWPLDYEPDFSSTDRLFSLPDGRVAVGGARPLLFDPSSAVFTAVTHPEGREVSFIGKLPDETICVQVRGGDGEGPESFLEQFDGENFHSFVAKPPDWDPGEIYFLHVTRNEEIWMGGSGGLAVWREEDLTPFGREDGVFLERPHCILEAGEGRIWFGGTDRILEYDGRGWSLVQAGLDRVNGLLKSGDGKIWAATTSGIHCYDNGVWLVHGMEDGLPSAAVYEIVEDQEGRIWAGTTQGLTLYHPGADQEAPRALEPRVEQDSGADGGVTIHFQGVDKWDQTSRERLLFSYRIDQGMWSPFRHVRAESFPNLGAGNHRIEVRALDRNWNESLEPSFLEFAVIVPWYKEGRIMAVTLFGLLLVLVFAGIAVNRHRQLVRSYAEVERIVAVRTRDLERAQQDLFHSQKMKAMGTLAAGIAHDFNNILSIIKGSVQIIEKQIEDKDKIRARIGRIHTVVDQGAGIVKSMLGLSRLTDKDLHLCDLNEVVEETRKLVGDRFLNEITIEFVPGPDLPGVLCSKELIQQVLVNLLLNAVDAVSGQGRIRLDTRLDGTAPANLALSPAQPPPYVSVGVTDSGSGMAPDILSRIFEPFFTTKAFSTRRGTGLGLSMVYELAKELGYGLAVESELGRGSTFRILIPMKNREGISAGA
jgi:signal transduction histidine kinase/ligand-binding sensor domain-containing protein